ncbi:c-type cytochrome [Chitinophaga sp. GCM10012297]|uniref:C-type cytochrome n=1 Tax=Chitinophaga chungangae TaxID=2821488 RepID=A0ABS3YKL1_9BACT|nr:c-type cytochrome [Chitinophaga chungangae]MBO9155220.1 c-type cytochrome [Chitinophaga chungangae]
MMKRFFSWALRIFLGIVTVIMLLVLYIQLTYRRKFDAPPTGIVASKDSAVIARGEYIVMGPGHCWTCHAPDAIENLQKGPAGGMSGGVEIKLPFGTLYTPNITNDAATGIGTYSDEMLARAIRFNVKHDRTALIPFMSYNGMSDEDLTAVISYLRATTPVVHEVPPHNINLLGKGVMRFLLKNYEHETPPPAAMKPDTTAEYGKYLAFSVTNCHGCHTNRDKNNGQFIGTPFAGGAEMPSKSGVFFTANLTPHPENGVLSKWSAEDFVRRFRTGAAYPESPMPWKSYQRMTDNDLKALYYFLKTVEPSANKVTAFRPKTAEEKKN